MRALFAIAAITVRTAVRSKTVLCLLLLMGLTLVGLPLTLKGDGTLAGQVHLTLNYTLNLLFLLLALTSLWAGCAAISLEMQERQMHLLATKPVRRSQIWLGKWLGLITINAALLLAAGLISYAGLRWQTRPAALSPADRQTLENEILTARAPLNPVLEPVEPDELEAVAQRLSARQAGAESTPPQNLHRQAEKILELQRLSVAPGQSRIFRFQLPSRPVPGRPLHLRFRLEASSPTASKVAGRWSVPGPHGFEQPAQIKTGTPQWLTLPVEATGPDGGLEITFTHADREDLTLLFNPEAPPQLFHSVGGFAMNLLRGLLILFFRLCLISALGVTFGALFSLPVAACCSVWMLILMCCRGFIQQTAEEQLAALEKTSALAYWAGRFYYQGLHLLTLPFQGTDPLPLLASGELVSWRLTLIDGLLQALCFCGLIALIGIGVFNRREIAGLNQG